MAKSIAQVGNVVSRAEKLDIINETRTFLTDNNDTHQIGMKMYPLAVVIDHESAPDVREAAIKLMNDVFRKNEVDEDSLTIVLETFANVVSKDDDYDCRYLALTSLIDYLEQPTTAPLHPALSKRIENALNAARKDDTLKDKIDIIQLEARRAVFAALTPNNG